MNDYYEEFQELQEKNTFRGQQWFGNRKRLVEKYSWGVPNDEVLKYISNFDDIVEIGAGTGYWAHLLEEEGVDVVAVDNNPKGSHTRVHEQAAFEVELRNRPALMVWPPSGSRMAETVLAKEPPHILYVGEWAGGCTARDSFFDMLERNYGLVGKIELPSYVNVNDNFYHYARKR